MYFWQDHRSTKFILNSTSWVSSSPTSHTHTNIHQRKYLWNRRKVFCFYSIGIKIKDFCFFSLLYCDIYKSILLYCRLSNGFRKFNFNCDSIERSHWNYVLYTAAYGFEIYKILLNKNVNNCRMRREKNAKATRLIETDASMHDVRINISIEQKKKKKKNIENFVLFFPHFYFILFFQLFCFVLFLYIGYFFLLKSIQCKVIFVVFSLLLHFDVVWVLCWNFIWFFFSLTFF